jgi:hypothetical protein
MAQAVRPIRRSQSGVTLERVGGTTALLASAVLTLGLIGLVLQPQGATRHPAAPAAGSARIRSPLSSSSANVFMKRAAADHCGWGIASPSRRHNRKSVRAISTYQTA